MIFQMSYAKGDRVLRPTERDFLEEDIFAFNRLKKPFPYFFTEIRIRISPPWIQFFFNWSVLFRKSIIMQKHKNIYIILYTFKKGNINQ